MPRRADRKDDCECADRVGRRKHGEPSREEACDAAVPISPGGGTGAHSRRRQLPRIVVKLHKQFVDLGPEVRRRGRTLGRKLIRAAGLKATYERSGTLLPFVPQITPRPKCPMCRVKQLNKPKTIWDTNEEVEEFCVCFPGLTPYPRPVGNGWHVARRRQ